MKVPVPGRQSTAENLANGIRYSFPPKRNVFLLVFLAIWLVGWGFGEAFAIRELVDPAAKAPDLFLTVWLAGWTLGGAFAFYAWFWLAFGKELVTLSPNTLSIKRDILGFGRLREYELSHVRNVRVAPAPADLHSFEGSMRFWGIGGGNISFDYGAKTFRFGGAIEEAEAGMVVKELKARYPFAEPAG